MGYAFGFMKAAGHYGDEEGCEAKKGFPMPSPVAVRRVDKLIGGIQGDWSLCCRGEVSCRKEMLLAPWYESSKFCLCF